MVDRGRDLPRVRRARLRWRPARSRSRQQRGCTIVMPAHRRQPFGGLVALTGLGLLAALLAAGCTSPSQSRQQPAAHQGTKAATNIAVLAAPGGVDVRAE